MAAGATDGAPGTSVPDAPGEMGGTQHLASVMGVAPEVLTATKGGGRTRITGVFALSSTKRTARIVGTNAGGDGQERQSERRRPHRYRAFGRPHFLPYVRPHVSPTLHDAGFVH